MVGLGDWPGWEETGRPSQREARGRRQAFPHGLRALRLTNSSNPVRKLSGCRVQGLETDSFAKVSTVPWTPQGLSWPTDLASGTWPCVWPKHMPEFTGSRQPQGRLWPGDPELCCNAGTTTSPPRFPPLSYPQFSFDN